MTVINEKKMLGGYFGFIVGDAMGVPVEFMHRQELLADPVIDMREFGSHPVPAGAWSDDTSMTIAFMDSFTERNGIDYDDIMSKFRDWIMFAKYTPTDEMFDVGRTCLAAISNYAKGAAPLEAGLTGVDDNGNGSLMRILPLAFLCMAKGYSDEEVRELVDEVSSLTHAHEVSRLGCYIYVKFVMALLLGMTKDGAYSYIKKLDYSMYSGESIVKYDRILKGDITELTVDEISSSGYVVSTLEAAMWVFMKASSFKEAIIGSVNLGDDTDTVGAVCGSLAGMYYGIAQIPSDWYETLIRKDFLKEIYDKFSEAIYAV